MMLADKLLDRGKKLKVRNYDPKNLMAIEYGYPDPFVMKRIPENERTKVEESVLRYILLYNPHHLSFHLWFVDVVHQPRLFLLLILSRPGKSSEITNQGRHVDYSRAILLGSRSQSRDPSG